MVYQHDEQDRQHLIELKAPPIFTSGESRIQRECGCLCGCGDSIRLSPMTQFFQDIF